MYVGAYAGPMCVVKRPKLHGPGEHYGISLPDGRFVDLNPTGVRILSAEEFAAGRDVQTVRVVDPSKYTVVRERLRQTLDAPPAYQLVGMNCEDFANWLSGEEAVSGQVIAAGLLGVIAVVCAAG